MKFEDRSQEETERQQQCARGKPWNLARNIYKLKVKENATFYSPSEEWVMLAASSIKLGERECGRSRSKYAYGQQERPQLCRIGYHEDIEEESDDGDDGQRRGANQRRSHGKCQTFGLIRGGDAS